MYYQANGNIWRLQFPYTYSNGDDTFLTIITLQKTGPSPIGTWTSVSNDACTDLDPLIIGGTIVGSNAIAMAPGSGTLPTLSISEIEYVSGDGNYSNPTLTSQITGDIISVDGTYTRNVGGTTSLSNGTYTISTNNGGEWFLGIPQESEAFSNDQNLNENNWHVLNGYVKGTASNTTATYYPAPIATNSNGYSYDFTLGEWQSTQTGYDPVPQVAYSHVWLDSISGFNNSGVMYTGNKHVTLVNNPTYSSDYSGIYSFNGVDQYAMTQEVPQSTDGSISYFVWFKPTGAGIVVSELGQPQPSTAWHDSQLEVAQNGTVNFGIWGAYTANPEFKIQSTGSIAFDEWHHLGLTYAPTSASSGILSAYINGEKIADSNCPSRLTPGSLYYGICANDSTNMGVGSYGQGFVGSFQVYNIGLTEIQIANLYSGEKDRFSEWIYSISNNEITINGYKKSGIVNIPSDINGIPVTNIGANSFEYRLDITNVIIPSGVTGIGDNAFTNCYNLSSVTMPNTLNIIGGGTFYGCTSLSSITVPNSVTDIGGGAFIACPITSIIIPNSVTSIGYATFGSCDNLTDLTIPQIFSTQLETIGINPSINITYT